MIATNVVYRGGGVTVTFDDGHKADAKFEVINGQFVITGLTAEQLAALERYGILPPHKRIWPALQLSDTTNQWPTTTGPTKITFNTIETNNDNRFSLINNSDIIVPENGVYAILAGAQIDEDQGGAVHIDIWLRKNNVDIPRTGCRTAVFNPNNDAVLILNWLGPLNSGDIVQIYQSVSDTTKNAGLHVETPSGEPVIPSILLTLYKVSDLQG